MEGRLKLSNKMYWTLIILLGSTLINTILSGLHYNTAGLYQRGRITIWPEKTNNLEEYQLVAKHEWAHYYMDKLAPAGFLKEWKKAAEKCGIETTYAKTYKNKATQISEEWAECYSQKNCCKEKMEMVNNVN